MATPARNPKDSMKSTWHTDKSQWGFAHHFLSKIDFFYIPEGQDAYPVFQKSDPIPYLTEWSCHRWILLHAAWPILVQLGYFAYFGTNMNPFATFLLFGMALRANAAHQVSVLQKFGMKIGFLDGDKHARDQVPDVGVNKVLMSIQLTTMVRAAFTVYLTYNRHAAPSLSLWLPLELALYSIVLDLFFYTYHRSCHEVSFLWKYHRTHHLTKHPNPLLSAYADAEQEFLEIALIPLMTWFTLRMLGLPMGFYDWWICHSYIIFAEAFGHSGLRVYSTTPGTASPLLKLLGCELVVEDHDLHHRKGWRKSANYGKQTRLWDRIFGTMGERIESGITNVDWQQQLDMPLY